MKVPVERVEAVYFVFRAVDVVTGLETVPVPRVSRDVGKANVV